MPITLLSYPNTHQQKTASSPVLIASPARASPKSLQAKHPPGLISMNNNDLYNSLNYYPSSTYPQSYNNTNNNLSQTPTTNHYPKINNLNNSRLKSVITSTTSDVIDLSSSPRSAVAAYQQHGAQHTVQHQQQQQQQQLHQHQMQQRNAMSNGRSVHHPPSAHVNNQAIRQQHHQQQQQHQQQQAQESNGRLNIIPEMSIAANQTPFKIQRVMVENVMIPCLNKKPYEFSELLLSMLDLRDSFFPGISLDNCRRVLEVLGIELYMGNK